MALAMTRPTTRRDSRQFQFKRRTPKKLLDARRGQRLVLNLPGHGPVETTVGEVIKLSLRTTSPVEAKQRTSAISQQIAELAETASTLECRLTFKQQTAMAGEVYTRLVAAVEDDPGEPAKWRLFAKAYRVMAEADEGSLAAAVHHIGPLVDLLLDERRLKVDAATRGALVDLVRAKLEEAGATLERRAKGDYSADPIAVTIPVFESPKKSKPGRSITALIKAWAAEAERTGAAPATIRRYQVAFRSFLAFLEHDDLSRVRMEEIIRYKDHRLVEQGRSPKGIKDGDLAGLKVVLGWGVINGHLSENPAAGVTLKVVKEKGVGYSEVGAVALLRLSLGHAGSERESAKMTAAKRWCPVLCAYSGARVGEIVQLRKHDVYRDLEGHWGMHIRREAGTVKGKRARWVPLHPHVIELGFLDFVDQSDDGHMFFNLPEGRNANRARATCYNRVTAFVRGALEDAGVYDPRVAPNHGWRHAFITRSRRCGMDQEKRRMITGHSGEGVDETEYGEPAGLYEEIVKLPRYAL